MRYVTKSREVLGTEIEICISKKFAYLINYCFKELERIDDTFSRFKEGNELDGLNSKIGKWQSVSNEMFELISYGAYMNSKTNGFVDMSMKEALENSGYDKDYSFEKKRDMRFERGDVDLKGKSVKISKPIEFGAFGKGYAVDKCVELLSEADNYYINAGGDVFAKGISPRGEVWRVLLEHPQNSSVMLGSIECNGLAIASSSANRRSWGEGFNHLINPNTGKSDSDVLGVFVKDRKVQDADCYATALFVMGYDLAKDFMKKNKISGLIISNGGKVFKTEGFDCEFFQS